MFLFSTPLLITLLLLIQPISANDSPYLLCPLGTRTELLNRNQEGIWLIDDEDTNRNTSTLQIEAKPCYCVVSSSSPYPAFCPAQFDTCRISAESLQSNQLQVTCLSMETTANRSVSDWVVPFLGPFVLLLYCGLALSCCVSRRGIGARDFLIRKLLGTTRIWGNDEQWLEWSLRRIQLRHRGWRRRLLASGVNRERLLIVQSGQSDPMLAPTHLELATKIYNEEPEEQGVEMTKSKHDETMSTSSSEKEYGDAASFARDLEAGVAAAAAAAAHKNDAEVQDTTDHDSLFSNEDEVICAICMGPVEPGDRVGDLPCRHVFHVDDCLKLWLKKKNECPMCSTQNIATRKA